MRSGRYEVNQGRGGFGNQEAGRQAAGENEAGDSDALHGGIVGRGDCGDSPCTGGNRKKQALSREGQIKREYGGSSVKNKFFTRQFVSARCLLQIDYAQKAAQK